MTRYFYTDPLEAAYMAQHLGMKICDPVTGIIEPSEIGTVFCARGYVTDDSLHLLEPQEGDEGSDADGVPCKYIHGEWRVFNIECCDWSGVTRDKVTISKRNGKAFFWPEREE